VTLRAVFPNHTGLLLPGMFVREELQEGVRQNGILAPQQGVTHNGKGEPTALVVGKNGKVQSRVLTADRALGNYWLVNSGLNEDDRLIVSGVQMVQPGIVALTVIGSSSLRVIRDGIERHHSGA
jgi:membrane fusion protein, multidrug efflux system